MPDLASLAAITLLGYVLGHTRPLWKARDWARWALFRTDSAPAILLALVFLPEDAWRAWRRRNTPPEPDRVPAPELGEKWQTVLDERKDHA